MWDTIIVGSGISALCAAAALSRRGRRVLMLEQHHMPGGLTQTFRRGDWSFATGVHYIGGVGEHPGPDGQFGRLLGWLSGGALEFAPCGNPYDIVRLPGFEFGIEHPESRYRQALQQRFPQQLPAIDRWFDQMAEARRIAMSAMALRGMPDWLAWGMRIWRGADIERLTQLTLAQALAEIGDAQLRAVLGARWGDYGAAPENAPLLEHALVTGAYNAGAYFPVGGPARFAQALLPALAGAGGELRLGASLEQIRVESGRVSGVVYRQGGELHRAEARQLISTIGVINTAACLGREHAPQWHEQVGVLRPGLSYLSLYLGFEGDIGAAGASAANVWVYESEHIGRVWADPAAEDAPALFVSFPSLKDPQSRAAPTAEVLALCDTGPFMPWLRLPDGARTEDYRALKAGIEQRLLAQFARHFPALMPMLRFHELSTPLTQRHFVRTPLGAMYGLEMDAQRLASPALKVRTPVPGLLLAGQDVSGAGIQAAAMSGLMAAAALEPALLGKLGGD